MQGCNFFLDIVTNSTLGITRHQRDLIQPQTATPIEENGDFCQTIRLLRNQSERVLLPIAANIREHCTGIAFSPRFVGL